MSNEAQAVRAQIEAALAAGPTENREWELWTGNSWRRIPGAIDPTIAKDNHPDLYATIETLKYVVSVQPTNIRTLLDDHDAKLRAANERIDVLTNALRNLLRQVGNIEVLGEWSAMDVNIKKGGELRAQVDSVTAAARAALATNQDTPSLQPSGASQ